MKVIDLLNKIANGEEVPKKIEFISDIYELSEDNCYVSNGNFLTDSINFDLSNLNDEIKLIEDEEIDIDIDGIKEFDRNEEEKEIFNYTGKEGEKSNLYCFSLWASHELIDKVNDLVKATKYLNKKIKEKENE